MNAPYRRPQCGILFLLILVVASLSFAETIHPSLARAAGRDPANAAPAAAAPEQTTYNDAVAGYALVRGPGTPDAAFSYSRAGGAIEVTNSVTGTYAVFFVDAASNIQGTGHPQVSAVGANAHCTITNWDTFGTNHHRVDLGCLDNDGERINSDFSLLVLDESSSEGSSNPNLAFTFTQQRSPAGGELDLTAHAETYHPGGGETVLFHTGTGQYSVVFRDLGQVMSTTAHVQLTPVLAGFMTLHPVSCRLAAQWEFAGGNLSIPVQCSDHDGLPIDAAFNVLVTSGETTAPGYVYALNDITEASTFTPLTNDYVYNPWGIVETIRLPGLDGYQLRFRGAATESGGNFIVTPVGPAASACTLLTWGASSVGDSLFVRTRCFNEERTHVDASFAVLSTFVDALPPAETPHLYLPLIVKP